MKYVNVQVCEYGCRGFVLKWDQKRLRVVDF